MTVYNAATDLGFESNETLATLRQDMLVRLGYAAQTNNPPPGMALLLNNFLRRSQNFLYRRYRALQTERYFHWVMVPGERFYGVLDDVPMDDPVTTYKLNPERITGVWLEDLMHTWIPMTKGVDASYFTTLNRPGIPTRYEIKQTIEVFPAPAAAYTLHVKGHFGLLPFVKDTDTCTINSDLLFLWALGNAKNHYGQADASDIAAEAMTMLKTLVGDSHNTARYIPGENVPVPATKPLFLG